MQRDPGQRSDRLLDVVSSWVSSRVSHSRVCDWQAADGAGVGVLMNRAFAQPIPQMQRESTFASAMYTGDPLT